MKPMYTPWDLATTVIPLNPNATLIQVHTPSHGGIGVHNTLPMPTHLQSQGIRDGEWRWFEEDELWACAAIAFPAHFKPETLEAAKQTLLHSLPKLFEVQFPQEKDALRQSRALIAQQVRLATKDKFITRSAFGDWAWDVPYGYCYLSASRASDGANDGFLVPSHIYEACYKSGGPDAFVLDGFPRWEPNRDMPYSKPKPTPQELEEIRKTRAMVAVGETTTPTGQGRATISALA